MAVLIDLRSGDPVLVNGDYVEVEDTYAVYQVFDNLLTCQKGTECLKPEYGFDLKTAIQMHSMGAPEEVIESLLAEALDPGQEPLIHTVDMIKAERDGQNMDVKISITSTLGISATLTETISTGES